MTFVFGVVVAVLVLLFLIRILMPGLMRLAQRRLQRQALSQASHVQAAPEASATIQPDASLKREEMRILRARIAEQAQALAAERNRTSELDKQARQAATLARGHERELKPLREKLFHLETLLETRSASANTLKTRIANLSEATGSLGTHLQQAGDEITHQRSIVAERDKTITRLQQRIDLLEDEADSLRKQSVQGPRNASALSRRLIERERLISELKAQLAAKTNDVLLLKNELAAVQARGEIPHDEDAYVLRPVDRADVPLATRIRLLSASIKRHNQRPDHSIASQA